MQDENLYKEVDIRAKKISDLKAMGINPYVSKFDITNTIEETRKLEMGTKVAIAGRMTFRRTFGKFMFIQLSDIYAKIQVSLIILYFLRLCFHYQRNFMACKI